MKKTTGYSINHNNMTITLTKAYMEKSSVPGTKEFRELVQLHKSFPDYHIVRRTAEVKQNKETHKGLTYAMMERLSPTSPIARNCCMSITSLRSSTAGRL